MGSRALRPGALVASPVFIGSIAVLLLNDHVLKRSWPGFVTGKLSDVAGVVMVAVGLTALLRRPGAACLLTAVAFGMLKTVSAVAEWAAPVLGGVTRTDPTDLVGLLALVPLWAWLRRSPSARVPTAMWLVPAQVAVVGVAVFATTATSCEPRGIEGIAEVDGVLYAVDGGDVYRSDDAGLTWTDTGRSQWSSEDLFADVDLQRDQDCVGATCFAVTHQPAEGWSTAVVLGSNGDSSVVFGLARTDRETLDAALSPGCGGVGYFRALEAFGVADRPVVLVAMGEAGALRRAPDGTWAFVSIGDHRIDAELTTDADGVTTLASAEAPFPWGYWITRLGAVVLIGTFWMLTYQLVRRAERRQRATTGVWTTAAVVSAVFGMPLLVLWQARDDLFGMFLFVAVTLLMGLAFTIALASQAAKQRHHRSVLPPPTSVRPDGQAAPPPPLPPPRPRP